MAATAEGEGEEEADAMAITAVEVVATVAEEVGANAQRGSGIDTR